MKSFIRIIEKILGIPEHGDSPRADVLLPNSVLFIGVGIFVVGIGCLIFTLIDFNSSKLIASILTLVVGIFTLIWWKNSTITILTTQTFEYKTMSGKTKTYRFDEITGYQKSYNFTEILIGKDKVRIEDTALMTQRLRTLLNKQFDKQVF